MFVILIILGLIRKDSWDLEHVGVLSLGEVQFQNNWEISFQFMPTRINRDWRQFLFLTNDETQEMECGVPRKQGVLSLWLIPNTLYPKLHNKGFANPKRGISTYDAIKLNKWNSFSISQIFNPERGTFVLRVYMNDETYDEVDIKTPLNNAMISVRNTGKHTPNPAAGKMRNLVIKTW